MDEQNVIIPGIQPTAGRNSGQGWAQIIRDFHHSSPSNRQDAIAAAEGELAGQSKVVRATQCIAEQVGCGTPRLPCKKRPNVGREHEGQRTSGDEVQVRPTDKERERKRGLMKGRSLVGRERETDDRIR
jgi:hypothetical protein